MSFDTYEGRSTDSPEVYALRQYEIKDSGQRASFASGMARDVQDGKVDWIRLFDGPMLQRWADHLTAGAKKYPNVRPNVPNWTLAAGEEEYQRFRASAVRHFIQWLRGDRDEDHGAATFFNINGAEYVRERMASAPKPMTRPFQHEESGDAWGNR